MSVSLKKSDPSNDGSTKRSEPTVCRLLERETKSGRLVLVARVMADVPAGSLVALCDVRGQLFLRVIETDDPEYLTAKQLYERTR
jgi:hypothetical protein